MHESETHSSNLDRESRAGSLDVGPTVQDPETAIRSGLAIHRVQPEYFSISDLAARWRVSRGTVYNRLRSAGAKVLDFAPPGKRGRKAVHRGVILKMEAQKTRRLC